MPGSIIAAYFGLTEITASIVAFAINMVASSILSKAFAPDSNQNNTLGDQRNPGSRIQIPPAGDNKIPIVYGSAYVGGIITDLSITTDNQTLYYCLALAEVTNTNTGSSPDTYTFGNVYWGGKKVIFSTTPGQLYKVTGLLDESTNITDTTVAGKLEFYFYRNGSQNPTNTAYYAYSSNIMADPNLTYQWDSTKLMTNCAFVIIKIKYSQTANLTGIQQTKFQITNSRYAPGDCINDYLQSTRYGAAIASSNIDAASLTALNVYSAHRVA